MDFQYRIMMIIRLLPFCLLAGLLGTTALLLIRRRKETEVQNVKIQLLNDVLLPFVAFAYFVLVLGIMFANGSNMREFSFVFPFAQYYEAMKNGSIYLLTNVLLNITVFIPFGFFMAVLLRKLRNIRAILSISLFVTVIIETLQMFTGKAAFSCDDIIGGIVGALLGYGVMCVVKSSREIHKKSKSVKSENRWFYLMLTTTFALFFFSYLYCGLNPATAETYYSRVKKIYAENRTQLHEYADRGEYDYIPEIESLVDMMCSKESFQLIFDREFNGRDLNYYGLLYADFAEAESSATNTVNIKSEDINSHNGFYTYRFEGRDYEIRNLEDNFYYFMINY